MEQGKTIIFIMIIILLVVYSYNCRCRSLVFATSTILMMFKQRVNDPLRKEGNKYLESVDFHSQKNER